MHGIFMRHFYQIASLEEMKEETEERGARRCGISPVVLRVQYVSLRQRVLSALDHALRNLLPQFDRIERLILAQPP
jgi:hypothetical protein